MIRRLALTAITVAVFAAPATASADVVTDWNRTMVDALEIAKTPPPPAARAAAIVQSAVFDAVNGIARRYTPVHVPPAAPPGASRAAAAARSWRCSLPSGRCSPGAGERVDRWEVGRHPAYDEEVSGDEVFETASVARRHTRTTSRNRSTSSAPS